MSSNTPTVANQPAFRADANALHATRQSMAVKFGSVLGGCLLVSLAAQLRFPIPGTEVPMTFQLLAVLLVGLSLSAKQSAAALSVYLLVGSVGIPVFSPGSIGVWGPTGGYLVGFIPAAWLISVFRGRGDASAWRLFGAGAVGIATVFACGVSWRIAWLAGDWQLAIHTGLIPFALKAIVELCLAIALVTTVRRWRVRRGDSKV